MKNMIVIIYNIGSVLSVLISGLLVWPITIDILTALVTNNYIPFLLLFSIIMVLFSIFFCCAAWYFWAIQLNKVINWYNKELYIKQGIIPNTKKQSNVPLLMKENLPFTQNGIRGKLKSKHLYTYTDEYNKVTTYIEKFKYSYDSNDRKTSFDYNDTLFILEFNHDIFGDDFSEYVSWRRPLLLVKTENYIVIHDTGVLYTNITLEDKVKIEQLEQLTKKISEDSKEQIIFFHKNIMVYQVVNNAKFKVPLTLFLTPNKFDMLCNSQKKSIINVQKQVNDLSKSVTDIYGV